MTNPYQDTIVAPATPPGAGAISIIRLSGPKAFAIADAVVQLRHGTISESKANTIHFGVIPPEAKGALLDEVLVSVFRAPHSYTGEDSVEISTHASSYIVSEAVRLLLLAGARLAQPGEFTRRAFLNGKMDLAQAEAVADVISSTTLASHHVAMSQLKGSISQELTLLRDQLLEMASLLELELDFSEEEVVFAGREQLLSLVEATKAHVDRLATSFREGNLIKNGVPVAIVGAANAGKSTLLNALVGEERAIVTDIPGTTRDTLEEAITINGILFRFIDTAGIRSSSDQVEKLGIERSFQALSGAEIVLVVLDASAPQEESRSLLEALSHHLNLDTQKVILLPNKTDKIGENSINSFVTFLNYFVTGAENQITVIPISAKVKNGLERLKDALFKCESGLVSNAGATFITNTRHLEALQNASSALGSCRTALTSSVPTDLVAEDLRRALSSVNAILGTDLIDPDTILHSIFAHHCIGK